MRNELRIGGDSYGPNAVGPGARASQEHTTINHAEDDRLRAAVDALRSLIAHHRERIPAADRATRDLDALYEEAQEPDPDPERLRDTVRRLTTRVGMVGPVLAAVNDLREILENTVGP